MPTRAAALRRMVPWMRRGRLAGLLLAAGLQGASADPLPGAAAARPASACGAGGLTLPGSDTCLRLGGAVRAEASATSRGAIAGPAIVPARRSGRAGFALHRPDVRIDAEVRSATSLGPVRAFVSVRSR